MNDAAPATGPLRGVRVVEFAGVGPAPFCGMMLSDMGADVLRIERPATGDGVVELAREFDPTLRGRTHLTLDLKARADRDACLDLIRRADVLIEGHRPGVMERLDLGPDTCLAANPRLVYCRVTGWGQDGPLARAAGHDINYIAANGILSTVGEAGRAPVPPLNLVGDYGGGGMMAAFGIVCALLEARASGRGQVVDTAMVDGSALLMAQFYGFLAEGSWAEKRASNILDGGAPWYRTYETSDGRHLAVGAFEQRFWNNFLSGLGIDAGCVPDRSDRVNWPGISAIIAERVLSKPLDHWSSVFAQVDACATPVLSLSEGIGHDHLRTRGVIVTHQGVAQPAPAPRLSLSPAAIQPACQLASAADAMGIWCQTSDREDAPACP